MSGGQMAALVIVFVIFMLLRLPDLRDRVIRLLGSRNLRVTTAALDEAAKKGIQRFDVPSEKVVRRE